jgi:hypothetical protein
MAALSSTTTSKRRARSEWISNTHTRNDIFDTWEFYSFRISELKILNDLHEDKSNWLNTNSSLKVG